MIEELDKLVKESFEIDSVTGLLVADENGLCVLAQGDAKPSSSGYFASITKRVKELSEFHQKENEIPTITLKLKNRKIFIRNEKGFTIATYFKN